MVQTWKMERKWQMSWVLETIDGSTFYVTEYFVIDPNS